MIFNNKRLKYCIFLFIFLFTIVSTNSAQIHEDNKIYYCVWAEDFINPNDTAIIKKYVGREEFATLTMSINEELGDTLYSINGLSLGYFKGESPYYMRKYPPAIDYWSNRTTLKMNKERTRFIIHIYRRFPSNRSMDIYTDESYYYSIDSLIHKNVYSFQQDSILWKF